MTKRTLKDFDDILRDLDPATAALTEEETRRGSAARERIMTAPVSDAAGIEVPRRRRQGGRALVAAAAAAAAAVAVPMVLGGGSAFASWSAVPEPLTPSASAIASDACRSAMGVNSDGLQTVMGERRGGWTFVLLQGAGGEAACLMPQKLIDSDSGASRADGFFGSYDPDPPAAPTPASDAIVESESMAGSVSLPGRLSLGTVDGWFVWVRGYVGRDVVAVTVDPPVGPDVEASVKDGRFSAWWPAGNAEGNDAGSGGAWAFTVTLADGTVQQTSSEPSGAGP
ncbi:hypothetical protein [Aeromicrobium sp.]|uniref:hypothetical protein n=1 Tax=Aeromicrobium sp. TaxID=1871063 RepID=UPI004033CCB4